MTVPKTTSATAHYTVDVAGAGIEDDHAHPHTRGRYARERVFGDDGGDAGNLDKSVETGASAPGG